MGRQITPKPDKDPFGLPEPGSPRASIRSDWQRHQAEAGPDHDAMNCSRCRELNTAYKKAAR